VATSDHAPLAARDPPVHGTGCTLWRMSSSVSQPGTRQRRALPLSWPSGRRGEAAHAGRARERHCGAAAGEHCSPANHPCPQCRASAVPRCMRWGGRWAAPLYLTTFGTPLVSQTGKIGRPGVSQVGAGDGMVPRSVCAAGRATPEALPLKYCSGGAFQGARNENWSVWGSRRWHPRGDDARACLRNRSGRHC
jgi:hypothetical protein